MMKIRFLQITALALILQFLCCMPGARTCPVRLEQIVASALQTFRAQEPAVVVCPHGGKRCPYAAAQADKKKSVPTSAQSPACPAQNQCPIFLRGQFTDDLILPANVCFAGQASDACAMPADSYFFGAAYSPRSQLRCIPPPWPSWQPPLSLRTGTILLRV